MKIRVSRKKEQPAIATSSLPDIVFMLLFFFMVVTIIKEPMHLQIKLSDAMNIQKLERKHTKIHLYVGQLANEATLQLNDQVFTFEQLSWRLNQLPYQDLDPQYTVVLEVDQLTDMGMVLDTQQLLRDRGISKIIYKTRLQQPAI